MGGVARHEGTGVSSCVNTMGHKQVCRVVSGSGCAECDSGRTICFRVGDMMPGDHGWVLACL